MTRKHTDDDDMVDCKPTFIALTKTRWEGSCPCGWWATGPTKESVIIKANGHAPERQS